MFSAEPVCVQHPKTRIWWAKNIYSDWCISTSDPLILFHAPVTLKGLLGAGLPPPTINWSPGIISHLHQRLHYLICVFFSSCHETCSQFLLLCTELLLSEGGIVGILGVRSSERIPESIPPLRTGFWEPEEPRQSLTLSIKTCRAITDGPHYLKFFLRKKFRCNVLTLRFLSWYPWEALLSLLSPRFDPAVGIHLITCTCI